LKSKNAESELLIWDLQKKILVLKDDRTKSMDSLRKTNELKNENIKNLQSDFQKSIKINEKNKLIINDRIETAQEVNFRIVAEGNAMNLNSLLLISEFSRVRLQDDNELLNQSAATLSNHRNQVMTENQTLLVSLEQAKSDLKLSQQNSSAENAVLKEQLKKLEAKRISRLKITTADTAKLRDQLLSTEQVVNSKDELYNELKATLVTLEKIYHVVQGECQTSLLEIDSKKDFIKKLEDSLASRQCEITRFKSTLNEDKKAVAEKNLEIGRLNAAYNESIKLLDEKNQGIVYLIQEIKGLTQLLASQTVQSEKSLSSEQNEIVRLKGALNQGEKSIALKNQEFAGLNAAYNESIKMLDEKKRGNSY
jgi:hypothetical protein